MRFVKPSKSELNRFIHEASGQSKTYDVRFELKPVKTELSFEDATLYINEQPLEDRSLYSITTSQVPDYAYTDSNEGFLAIERICDKENLFFKVSYNEGNTKQYKAVVSDGWDEEFDEGFIASESLCLAVYKWMKRFK